MSPLNLKSRGRAAAGPRKPLIFLVLAVFLWSPHGDLAAKGTLDRTLSDLLDFYTARTSFNWPTVSSEDIGDLIGGEPVVKMAGHAAGGTADEVVGMGVYGLQIVEAPRLLIWLTVMGGNDERDYRLTPATLARGDAGSYVRYQHVDLPWPVHDRHWVIHCQKNVQLATESDGEIWEHYWTMQTDGREQLDNALAAGRIPKFQAGDLDNAVYLSRNRGAWALIELAPDRTLVIAYVDADLGGRFPDALVRRFTRSKLKAGLASLKELSSRVHLNYSEERLIHDGHGNPIARQDALQVASSWRDAVQIATLTR